MLTVATEAANTITLGCTTVTGSTLKEALSGTAMASEGDGDPSASNPAARTLSSTESLVLIARNTSGLEV